MNKNPGLQLTGFGEVLPQILGKKVMYISKKVHKNSAGALQVCACQEAEPEAAENAVNSINRKAMLHNKQKMQFSMKDFFSKCEQICSCSDISITCPIIATFILNCYMEPAISFVVENKKKQKKLREPNRNVSLHPWDLHFFFDFLNEFFCSANREVRSEIFLHIIHQTN